MDRRGVLAVLVAHASGSWLQEALESLSAQSHGDLEIVVARVGDLAVPKRSGVRVRALPPGTGFAAAVNDAVRAAGGDHPYLLVLHDDVVLEPDTVSRLVEEAERSPDAVAVGAKLLEMDRPHVLQEVGGSIDRFAVRHTGIDPDEVDHGQYDDTSDVLYASSACLLVRRSSYDEVGGFDAGSWPLYDDVDLCWRLRRAGGRVVVAPAARARHAAALSRGRRRAAGRGFGSVGLLVQAERGRLRFMLKNYAAVSLAVILPQYLLISLWRLGVAVVRREFWRVRTSFAAWARIAGELGRIREARRSPGPHRVDDQELLQLASRRAVLARRAERVGTVSRFAEGWAAVEQRVTSRLRDPATWAAVAASAVVLLVMGDVLWGGTFTLGEVRPFPRLAEALRSYAASWHPGRLDPAAPAAPGILILGALRSVVRSRALAEKVLLMAPLIVAAGGGARLSRVMGVEESGRRWLAVLTAVNPVTLLLLRDGLVGPLVLWAATPWFVAAFLNPPHAEAGGRMDEIRWRSRWALGAAAVTALHPPTLPWLLLVFGAIVLARSEDGLNPRRLQLLATAVAGAFLLCLPWSLQWFTQHTPLLGWPSDVLGAGRVGLAEATFGIGWPLLAWLAVALVMSVLVGPTRTTVSLILLLAVVWLGGSIRVIPRPSAAAAVGWCVVLLLAFVARRVRDEIGRYELGWRQGVVVLSILLVGSAWAGAAVGAVSDGADAQHVRILPPGDREGRVLWLWPASETTVAWVTDGFRTEMTSYPAESGPELRLLRAAVDAAERGRTHRAGSVLALGDVSHVVVLGGPAPLSKLGQQADLVLTESQQGGRVYDNEAWMGPAMRLVRPPRQALSAEGLAALVEAPARVPATPRGRGLNLRVEEPGDGVLYLAGGLRRGWTIDGERARPVAAGVWVEAEGVSGPVRATPPMGWTRIVLAVQALAFAVVAGAWVLSLYLAGPGTGPVPIRRLELRLLSLRSGLALVPVLAAAGAGVVAWSGLAAAVPDQFLSTAWFCPPAARGATQQLAIVNPGSGPARFLVRPALAAPATESAVLPAGARRTIDLDPPQGAVVEAYGRDLAVATVAVDGARSATTVCASDVERTVVFAEGGRGATRARERLTETYVLYNPFPEPARAAVRFYTPDETISPPALQDVTVEPGGTATVDPETQLEPQNDLSVEVTVWQGRALVSRRLSTPIEVNWSLGTIPSPSGAFPRVSTLEASSQIVVVNPRDRAGEVVLTLVGEQGSLPRATFEVEPRSRTTYDLAGPAPDHEQLLVQVRAAPPMAMEAVVVPQQRTDRSILALQQPRAGWVVPAAEGRTLLLGNPGTRPVRVALRRLGPGPALRPVTVPPARIVAVDLRADPGPFGVALGASGGPVTAAVVGGQGAAPALPR
ncbi:MAG TPA: DUF5719 family protein [Actinomycetota bacterium]|nr:DUF5719 family protein [Actinomycetota bacterium]